MARQKRFNASIVNRDIQNVMQTFPTIYVEFKRATKTYTALKAENLNLATAPVVYKGEVLDIPDQGSAFKYPMGEVLIEGHGVLVNGKRDIQQGDFVTLPDARLYIVKSTQAWWGIWFLVALQQYQQ